MATQGNKGRICLAYSGGLDTSCILRWLIEEGYTVVAFLANVGQQEDWAAVEKKALKIGAEQMIIEDLRKEFVDELCFPAIQCNAIYEGQYLLGTSLARPVIARAQMRAAERTKCDFVSHGCVRFELAFYTINPRIRVIAPWREPRFFNRFQGRNDLLDYAASQGIPTVQSKAKPYSMDDNFAHCSYEAGILEDPSLPPPDDMWTRTVDPRQAPDEPTDITIEFTKGIPTKVVTPTTTATESVQLFELLNQLGHDNGIGRIDIVENRFIGLKSRGCYDSPAMTILRLAHMTVENLVMDGQVRSLRDQFVTHTWSTLLYNGKYFSPEREFIEHASLFTQKRVNGEVKLRLYKGVPYVRGVSSATEKLYDAEQASMDTINLEDFNPEDTTGFIAINAIRLKKYGLQKQEEGESLTRA